MTTDFSKYQHIIDQFRGEVSASDFETRFTALTRAIPKKEKFLLKMELKRLASVCTRLIDLRGLVDGECYTYEHENKVHFLDDIAVKVFEENIAYYDGYTFGVYEAVNNTENNFRVIYNKQKVNQQKNTNQKDNVANTTAKVFEKTQYPATFYQFGQYFNRIEERMNFALPLSIVVDGKQVFKATMSDISVHGCKFKVPDTVKLAVGQIIDISFIGLESECSFSDKNSFGYEICNVSIDANVQLVGVKRVDIGKKETFIRALKEFIQSNKRRYKINIDNSIQALQARSLEQFTLPLINELPVFLMETTDGILPRYALTSTNNQAIYQYWQDEKTSSTLHFLMNKTRLESLEKALIKPKRLLVYSFIHHNKGAMYFYSADEEQLKCHPDFMQQFLAFAASKPSFAVTELSVITVKEEGADSPFTVPDTILNASSINTVKAPVNNEDKKSKQLNDPVSSEVKSILTSLPYIIVANDLTHKCSVAEYQQFTYDDIDIKLLKSFGHKRSSKSIVVDELGVNYKNHRKELRFKYETQSIVTTDNENYSGVSCDFSISGLRIKFPNPVSLKKGNVVNLSFPTLQKITSAFDLKNLPYEVVHINKKHTVLNLRVHIKQHQHIGRSFFKLLIEKNKDKLTVDEYANIIPGLFTALRNLYANSIRSQSLIIQTSGSRYKIESLCSSGVYGDLLPQMHQLSDRPKFYNLYPLLNNLQATNFLNAQLKRMSAGDEPVRCLLYIAVNDEVEAVNQKVTTQLASELVSIAEKKQFIRDALKFGSFFCVQIKLSRTAPADMEYLSPELNYISSYAIHRGKQIEEDILRVTGVIQLLDMTKDTLLRHKLLNTIDV